MGRETILVVDDSEFIIEFLGKLLDQEGFGVVTATNVAEAINALEEGNVNLLLTDLNMPGADGMELVKHVHEQYPEVISLIMTGFASLETAREAIVYGVLDYVFKPFKSAEILAAVGGAIERVRLRSENARLRESQPLSNASQVIMDTTGRNTNLAQTVVTAGLTQTRTRYGALLAYCEDRKEFELRYTNAEGLDEPCKYPSGTTFVPDAFQLANRGTFLVSAGDLHPLGGHVRHITLETLRKLKCPEVLPIEQEALYVPLRAQGRLKAIVVLSKQAGEAPFAPSDLPVISIIANLGATSFDNESLAATIEQNYVNTLISLNIIIEAKHPYTKGHTNRVIELVAAIGRHVELGSTKLQDLREGAMLHDIGKLAISDAILNKLGPLTDEEMESVRQHPLIGDTIVRPIKFLQHCRPVVRHHHERWDGGGYPDGLKGDEISLFARICTIADAVDAMASERSYRAPLSFPQIYDQVLMGSGTQFDEELVKVMLRMIERGEVTNIAPPRKLVVG